jgi:hypothetical protein
MRLNLPLTAAIRFFIKRFLSNKVIAQAGIVSTILVIISFHLAPQIIFMVTTKYDNHSRIYCFFNPPLP